MGTDSLKGEANVCLLLMEAVLKTPALVDRLFEVLKPAAATKPTPQRKKLAQSNARSNSR